MYLYTGPNGHDLVGIWSIFKGSWGMLGERAARLEESSLTKSFHSAGIGDALRISQLGSLGVGGRITAILEYIENDLRKNPSIFLKYQNFYRLQLVILCGDSGILLLLCLALLFLGPSALGSCFQEGSLTDFCRVGAEASL